MIISIVVAASEDNAIGKDNQLLWKLPNDMKFFKNLTWGMPVVMGRKTFESIGSKALPGRLNIVLTRQINLYNGVAGVVSVNDFNQAIQLAVNQGYKELFVIGGSELYHQTFAVADKIYLTRVHSTFPGADTHIDEIDVNKFELISSEKMCKDEKHAVDYSFETWQRVK
jgi:dihydrofolate reductase